MEGWRDRVWLCFSLTVLLVGWLGPSYAAKCIGTDLATFFVENPLTAALIGQSSFVLLAALPRRKSSRSINDTSCSSFRCIGFSRKSLKIGLPLGILVGIAHTGFYGSIPRTTVGMNTALWNSDTVTTPLVHAMFSLQLPSFSLFFGGITGLVGVWFCVDSDQIGNTTLGCGMCLAASVLYAFHAVIVERLRKNDLEAPPVTQLLASEGMLAVILLLTYAIATAIFAPEWFRAWCATMPAAHWIAITLGSTLCLNLGWLWCTELAGASWAAMGASLSIPIAMVLDYVLLSVAPVPMSIFGACLILLGFVIVSVLAERYGRLNQPNDNGQHITDRCRERWKGWFSSGTAPLLLVDGLEEGQSQTVDEGTSPKKEEATNTVVRAGGG